MIPLSFKLEFEVTNNVAEYEAFLLRLQRGDNMGYQGKTTEVGMEKQLEMVGSGEF